MDVLSFLGLGPDFTVGFELEGTDRPAMGVQGNNHTRYFPIFANGESVQGQVVCTPENSGDLIQFEVMKLELIGEVSFVYARDKDKVFTCESYLLEKNDSFSRKSLYPFRFETPTMPYESYSGTNAEVRYYIKFTCVRNFAADVVYKYNIWVIDYSIPPEINAPIKMEVGIEDMLHLEFEYDRCRYHLDDIIVGKIYFLMVRLRLKCMLLEVIKREVVGAAPYNVTEVETLTQYEVMDGVPIRGESIPVRLNLGWIVSLTPTYTGVHDLFSVKYSLNLVLVDEEDRRYFKQTPILLWRQQPGGDPQLQQPPPPADSSSATTTTTHS